MSLDLIPQEQIEKKIYLLRGRKVMLDSDLAILYGVKTFNLNKAVKRNIKRFPDDFMFQLTKHEAESLRFQIGMSNLTSQIAMSKKGRGGRRTLPYAFTEQGVAMLSSVLNSERAIQVNIQVMRTFTKIREIISSHKYLQKKMEIMERKYDRQFKIVFDLIRMTPAGQTKRIGFAAG